MFKITTTLVAVFALLVASELSADSIKMVNGNTKADNELRIVGDTMRRVAWDSKDGKFKGNATPWEVLYYRLQRGKKARQARSLETEWNKVVRSGYTTGSWTKIEKGLEQARSANQAVIDNKVGGYKDLHHMNMRLLYLAVRAKAELGEDPSAEFEEYHKANVTYAEGMQEDRSHRAGLKYAGARGIYKAVDCGSLHSTSVDVFMALATYYRNKNQPNDAYEKGYRLAAELADEIRKGTNNSAYVVKYSVVAQQAAAEMFSEGDKPDWEKAAKAYSTIHKSMISIDKIASRRAELNEARCNVQLGGAGVSKAKRVYDAAIKQYEGTINANRPPVKGWLTAQLAAYYAAAYTGMGHINMSQKKHFKALKNFSKSLALFSTDRNERADALLHAGFATVKLAEANDKKAGYYYKSGIGYYYELVKTLEETPAASRAPELSEKLAKIKPEDEND